MHPENASTPLFNPFDYWHDGVADSGRSAKSRDQSDMWATQIESVPEGKSDNVQLAVQHDSGDVGIAVQDGRPDGDASLALWEISCGEGSISALGTDYPASPARVLETDGPNLLLHATGLPPGSANNDKARSDKSPLKEGDCVQKPLLTDEQTRNSTGLTAVESSLVEQGQISRAGFDVSADGAPLGGSTCDRALSSPSAGTTDVANVEGSDSDGPPLASRRRRILPRTRNSRSRSPPLTPRSSADSIDMEPTTALRHWKRLRRRKVVRRDSLALETEDTSASLTTSRSNKEGDWRPIQCFVQRKMNGTQDVILIQLPELDLCARSGRASTLSLLDVRSPTRPISDAASEGRRRARFSRAEEDLLVKLKEQRGPKLSWREIQRRFPNRTTGSLQVHYSTHLKSRGLSKGRACGRS